MSHSHDHTSACWHTKPLPISSHDRRHSVSSMVSVIHSKNNRWFGKCSQLLITLSGHCSGYIMVNKLRLGDLGKSLYSAGVKTKSRIWPCISIEMNAFQDAFLTSQLSLPTRLRGQQGNCHWKDEGMRLRGQPNLKSYSLLTAEVEGEPRSLC